MIRKVLSTQDPKLRQLSKPVLKIDRKILFILRDLEDTLKDQNDPEGVGLAAPQIGEFYQMFIMRDKKNIVSVLNPKIIKLSKKTNDPKKNSPGIDNKIKDYIMEGCLSLPHYYGPVKRSWGIELTYQSPKLENGEWILENKHEIIEGFTAQIIQHEVDHLKGKFFIDNLLEQKRRLFKLKNNDWTEVDLI